MPQVTVYIRKEDLEAWKEIVHKSEFIHNALQDRSTYDGGKIVLRETTPEIGGSTVELEEPELFLDVSKGTAIATSIPELKKVIESRAVLVPTCKIHGTPLDYRGRCTQKGCKYA